MYLRVKFLLVVLFITSLSAFPSYASEQEVKFQKKPLPDPPVSIQLSINDRSAVIDRDTAFVAIDDELAMLFYSGKDIVFQKGKTRTVLESGMGRASRFWLVQKGKYLYALWWRKFTGNKGKQLFFSVSEDKGASFSKPVVISTDEGILPSINIAADDTGRIAVTYHDERNLKLQSYTNISTDAGKTWLSQDVRLDQDSQPPLTLTEKARKSWLSAGVSPDVFIIDGKAVFVWLQLNQGGSLGYQEYQSRTYDFANQSWSKVHQIQRSDDRIGSEFSVTSHEKYIVVLTSTLSDAIHAYVSDDFGETWGSLGSNYPSETSDKKAPKPKVSFLNAIGVKDKLFVVSSREEEGAKVRNDISQISLSDKKWIDSPQTLDRGKDHKLTRSHLPLITKLGDGTVITAWEDYRDILSNVYIDASFDDGKTWLNEPMPAFTPGVHNIRLVKVIPGIKKAYVIVVRTGVLSGKPVEMIAYIQVSVGENKQLALSSQPLPVTLLPIEESKARLEQRAKEFWALRKAGDWEATWIYFDPKYRLKFGRAAWLSTQGKLRFGDFTFEDAQIEKDIFASTKGKVQVGIPLQDSEEGIMEAAPFKERPANLKWGWFYNDWYIMPEIFFMKVHDY